MQLRSFMRGLAIMHAKCRELHAIHGYLWMTNMYQTGVHLREEHNRCATLLNRLRRRHFLSALLVEPIAYLEDPMIAISAQQQQQQPRQRG